MMWLVTISIEMALGVMVGSMRLQYTLLAKETNSVLDCMKENTVNRLKEGIILLYSPLIRQKSTVLAPSVQ